MTKTVNNGANYTENWITVKSINNGVIELDNKMKVSGVKIIPKNIFILDQSYQDNIIMALKALYNSIDYEFWLVSIDRPVDISGYLSNLQILYNETQDIYRRKLIMEDLDKANDFMKDNVTDIEYYILFKAKDNGIPITKINSKTYFKYESILVNLFFFNFGVLILYKSSCNNPAGQR